jgi:antitoxin component YwqK of YwqJK toxin-antitoxin module
MKLKILSIALLLGIASIAPGQTTADINKTDQQGRKQGHWIKKYPRGNTMYEGSFIDDKPVGEFKRFNSNNTLKSILIYSSNSKEADASIYHPNGFISSKGKYVDQLKEGKWRFYSSYINGCLICEEVYSQNIRNGLSLNYYTDSTLAEKVNYIKGVREGEWLKNYPDGKILLKANYVHGELDGKFEAWYNNGKPEFSGTYKRDMREGKWKIYGENGVIKYEINYVNGITKDRQMDLDASNFFNRIEKTKGKIPDPEKSGNIR